MKTLLFFRFSIFWIWTITLGVSLAIFIGAMIMHSMTFREIEEPMTRLIGVLIPQLSVMIAFFFGTSKSSLQKILQRDHGMARLAVGLSIFYHVIFWVVLGLSIGGGLFGQTIDENAAAAIKIMGFLSIFGLSPVAYLFARSTNA